LDGLLVCLYWNGYEWSVCTKFSVDASEGVRIERRNSNAGLSATSTTTALTVESLFWAIWEKRKYKYPPASDRNLVNARRNIVFSFSFAFFFLVFHV
jgi:hypothetical protein